jgi:uncharacterized membrane protein YeaQ/YmgE (transglycosylase-associated protein family)
MELAMDLGAGGLLLLLVVALLIGSTAQEIGTAASEYEWVVTTIAALLGGLVASECIVAFRDVEPVWDGLALIPALVGALGMGVIAEVVTRRTTGGTWSGRPLGA